MGLLVFYFLLTILISFTCSLLESSILSVTPTFIEIKRKEKRRSAKLLAQYTEKIDQPLTAILTINTSANMIGAAGVGAQTFNLFGSAWMAGASAILTVAVLALGEILPKTLGATRWKAIAPAAVYLIRFMIVITYPVVVLTEWVNKKLGIQRKHVITREEILVSAEMSESHGAIRPKESAVIRNVLKLEEILVKDIMTPRSVVMALDSKQSVQGVLRKNKSIHFSRIPVFEGNFDHVVGLIYKYKLMEAASQDLDDLPIEKFIVPIHKVPEDISVAAALDQFIKRKEHLFLAVDSYGVPVGLVTLEDAIETLLGVEIVDESDNVVDMREHAMEQWKLKKKTTWTDDT